MTLILTALCKDGICICADKISQTWRNGVLIKTEDNLNKIYRFKSIPLVIFNHGINKFDNKSWDMLCCEYEKTGHWKDKTLEQISCNFKIFIEGTVVHQLVSNLQCMPNTESIKISAFVLCGKDNFSNNFEFYELCWDPDFKFNCWKDKRIIGSGEGYEKYLKKYLIYNAKLFSVEFWACINTKRAKEELKKLFFIAKKSRDKVGGDEFSDNHDIECIT
ncbi:MAG: hypothetical protein WC788_07345 [Candidatus Paceibacterota bacterium]|jgi:hypothetical protein